MAYTSLPSYLDPPQWHQQPNHQLGITSTNGTNENHPQLAPLPQPESSTGSIRASSMTDRARIAKIPQPESALKCPRCESTNTKFCYFNNYSLSQPRHFCKTCRRYWTRGGALRSVPVGGGCRRNKRSKGNSSKSSANAVHKVGSSTSATSTSTNTTTSLPSTSFTSDIISNMSSSMLPQLPFMTSLQNFHEYGDHMGLSASGIQPSFVQGANVEFQTGNSTATNGAGGGNNFSEQWRFQQFPFSAGATYPFESDLTAAYAKTSPAVKMEETQGLNLSRPFMGVHGNDQYWSGGAGGGGGIGSNAWTDLSGFSSSTTNHHLL